MNEQKSPKKTLLYYVILCAVLILAFNAFIIPSINRHRIKETNYSFFLDQIEDGAVEQVQIKDDTILFKINRTVPTIFTNLFVNYY